MNTVFSVVAAAGMIVASAGGCLASSVGLFTGARGNLAFAGSTSWETLLTDQGHTVSSIGGSIIGNLDDKDVVITGLLNVSGGATATATGAAQAGEIAALTDWLNDGGTFVITGEHNGFVPTYNTWLNPFGVNLTGVNYNFNAFASFVNDPTDPYLGNGVAGGSIPISNRGWYDLLPTGAEILAGGTATPFIFEYAVGAGSIIGIADTHLLRYEYGNAGRNFLLNIAENAPGYSPTITSPGTGQGAGSGVSNVPVPPSVLLLLSALFGTRVFQGISRRKSNVIHGSQMA